MLKSKHTHGDFTLVGEDVEQLVLDKLTTRNGGETVEDG